MQSRIETVSGHTYRRRLFGGEAILGGVELRVLDDVVVVEGVVGGCLGAFLAGRPRFFGRSTMMGKSELALLDDC